MSLIIFAGIGTVVSIQYVVLGVVVLISNIMI